MRNGFAMRAHVYVDGSAGSLKSRRLRLIATLSFAGLAASCSGGGQGQSQAGAGTPPGVPVKVEIAQVAPVKDTTEYVATLKSRESAVIMPEVEGTITQIYVHSGDHVSAGAPLVQIDPRKQQATVSSQEEARKAQQANVEFVQQQYGRTLGLYKAGVVSKQDLDQAKMALDSARAQLDSLDAQVRQQQVQLHYFQVVAPRAGIVGDVPVRVGDRVITSTVLTTVDQPGPLEAYVYVPVERSSEIKMNMPVEIVDANDKVLAHSRVTFISPQVDSATQSVLVKATISNSRDRLRTSQFIRAQVVWGQRQAPRIPVLAVSTIGGQYFVFVAENENGKIVARQKLLHLGEMVGNDYIVLDGIKPGDKVIVSGTQFLTDGAPVMPQV